MILGKVFTNCTYAYCICALYFHNKQSNAVLKFMIWPLSYHIVISHAGSGVVPVDGVGRISYGHCLYHASPFRSITCILFHQSIFLHLILYLLFPRLFRSSSTTTHFKFQSLHYHIFIFFMIWPLRVF